MVVREEDATAGVVSSVVETAPHPGMQHETISIKSTSALFMGFSRCFEHGAGEREAFSRKAFVIRALRLTSVLRAMPPQLFPLLAASL